MHYSTISEYYQSHLRSGEAQYKEIEPSVRTRIRAPKTMENDAANLLESNPDIWSGSSCIYTLPDCRVQGRKGTVITKENCLINLRLLSNKNKFRQVFFETGEYNKHIQGTVAFINGRWSKNYFHWMMGVVPKFRILELSQIKIDKYYLYCVENFHFQTIKDLGITDDRLMNIQDTPSISADRVVFPEKIGHQESITKQSLAYLRNLFLSKYTENNGSVRLYVSRANSRRRVINDCELKSVLAKYDFIEVELENLTVEEQASLFARAEIVVSPHGAGLTNIAFCEKGTIVVEIFSPEYLVKVFWLISHHAELDYYYVIGESDNLNYDDDQTNVKDKNIYVSVDKIESTLRCAGIKKLKNTYL